MFRVKLGLRVAGLLGIVVVAIGLPTVLATSTLESAVEANQWVDQTRAVLSTLERLQLLAADVEGGSRGFALVGAPELKALYEAAAAEAPTRVSELKRLMTADPEQLSTLTRLEQQVGLQRMFAAELASAGEARPEGIEQALSLTQRIRSTTEEIRAELRKMRAFEQAQLARRIETARGAASRATPSILVGAISALVLALAGTVTITRSITSPIRRLLEGVSGVGRGELESHVPTRRGDAYELGVLTSAFNDMVVRRREAEAALRAARDEAAAANRELDAFSYSVSHDLRAPLRTIDGFARALEEDAASKLTEEELSYLQRIRSGAQRMSSLIDALLGLSRVTRTELRREPVDLGALAQEVMSSLPAQHPIELRCEGDLTAQADPRLVRIALTNLLGNAVKFTSRLEVGARVEIGRQDVDGVSAFFIRDNGAGFEPRYVDKLFTAFQRLHRVTDFEGSGIGLATTARVVRRHGGRIWAEGAVDRGATFYFTLEPRS